MSCDHKFKEWLTLPSDKVDWEVNKLIIGTFNPGGGTEDENNAAWFYGRTQNNYFWQVLPELMSEESLLKKGPTEWQSFCRRHRIGITDLITSIPKADLQKAEHRKALLGDNFSDGAILKTFPKEGDIEWTDLKSILEARSSISEVYLTNTGSGEWGKRFDEAKRYAAEHPKRKLKVVELYTPSKEARYWMSRRGFDDLVEFIKHEWTTRGFETRECT